MTNVWPITAVGVPGDWTFSGNTGWQVGFGGDPDTVNWTGDGVTPPGNSDIAALTGSALTTINAAISNGASCGITIYPWAGFSFSQNSDLELQIRIKGGTWTTITIPWSFGSWDDPATGTVVAGSGSGFEIRANASTDAFDTAYFVNVEVDTTTPPPAAGHSFGIIIGA